MADEQQGFLAKEIETYSTSASPTTVVISPEDCNAVLDFWHHFSIPVPEELQAAISAFAEDASLANQNSVRLEISKAIVNSDHEAFKEDMFQKIVEECAGVTFDMQFDKELEKTLTIDKE